MPALKSTWWRPRSLAEIGRLSDADIREQEKAYVAWLRELRNYDAEQATAHIEAQREIVAATPPPVIPTLCVKAERPMSARVTIRTVRTYTTGEHWEPDAEKGGGKWRRLHKPDAPTLYCVMVDGRRRDSFLLLSRAKELADRLAKETRQEDIATVPALPAPIPAPVVNLPAVIPAPTLPVNFEAFQRAAALSAEQTRALVASRRDAVTVPAVPAPRARTMAARFLTPEAAAMLRPALPALPPPVRAALPVPAPVPALPAPVRATARPKARKPRLPRKGFWMITGRGVARVELGR